MSVSRYQHLIALVIIILATRTLSGQVVCSGVYELADPYERLAKVINCAELILEVTLLASEIRDVSDDERIVTNTFQIEKIFKGTYPGDTIRLTDSSKKTLDQLAPYMEPACRPRKILFGPGKPGITTVVFLVKQGGTNQLYEPILSNVEFTYNTAANTSSRRRAGYLAYSSTHNGEIAFRTASDIYDFIGRYTGRDYEDITHRSFK